VATDHVKNAGFMDRSPKSKVIFDLIPKGGLGHGTQLTGRIRRLSKDYLVTDLEFIFPGMIMEKL
jgi:hypothetical protein